MDPLEPLRRVGRDLFNPDRIAAAIEAVLWIAIISIAGWLTLRVALGLVRRTSAWQVGHPAARMTPIVEGLLRYAIVFTALILMLGAVHVNVTPVLASATVLGVALGFGAQQIIRDLLAGIFLVSEGIVQMGDTVRIQNATGTSDVGVVERVSLRMTQIRQFSGELVTVPNGSITKVGNLTRGYGRAVVQVPILYGASAGAALDALHEAIQAWSAAHAGSQMAEPQIDGITDLRDGGAVIQCSVLVAAGAQWSAASELRQHVLEALARRGITPGALFAPSGTPPAG